MGKLADISLCCWLIAAYLSSANYVILFVCFLFLFFVVVFFHVTSGSVVQICTQPTGIIHFSRGKPQNWQSADPECSI